MGVPSAEGRWPNIGPMVLPAEALRLLKDQFGVAGRWQLTQWMPAWKVDSLLRRGVMVSIERGVYRPFGAVTREQQAMAALLRAGPKAALTGPFVLGLFDVDGFSVRDTFEVLVQPGRRLHGVSFAHRTDPTPRQRTFTRGPLTVVPITTALVDAGRWLDRSDDRRLRVAYDHCRWRGLTTAEKIAARARELGPRDLGAARFSALLHDAGLWPESEGERALGRAIAGFRPPPEPQVWIGPYRVDWFWRLYRLGLEYQGVVDHAGAAAQVRDTARIDDLFRRGVRILTVTARQLQDVRSFQRWVHAQLVIQAYDHGLPAPTLVS